MILSETAPHMTGEKNDVPRRVLFVCTGNTCRSPMAAALYNDMYTHREVCSACPDGAPTVDTLATSAGLYAVEGDPITPEAVSALQEAGVVPLPGNDYTAHRARPVSAALLEEADLVIGISGRHAMELMLRFPEAAPKIVAMPMDIPDPFGRGAEAYRACLMQLRYCLAAMGEE